MGSVSIRFVVLYVFNIVLYLLNLLLLWKQKIVVFGIINSQISIQKMCRRHCI